MASVKADRVIDNFVTLIDFGAGQGERFYTRMREELQKMQIPQLSWMRSTVNIGFMTQGREFFIIKHDNLPEYTIYVFARDVGQHLDCGWFTTVEPGGIKRFLSRRMSHGDPLALSRRLDLFAQQDLAAWTYAIHRTFLRIIKNEIMRDLNIDSTGMNTQSKGFLSVW